MESLSPEVRTSLEFHFILHDLYTEGISDLRAAVGRVGDTMDQSGGLRGPLQAVIFEMAANALKALYKRAYFDYMMVPLGLSDLPYEDWLELFRTEIGAHRAENFAHLCRDKGICIEVTSRILPGNILRIDVANEGLPSDTEWKRLRKSLEEARHLQSMIPLLEMDREDGQQEGAGLGLPLIILSLRGVGIDPEGFTIFPEGQRTVARLDIPLALSPTGDAEPMRVMTRNRETLALVWNLFRQMELAVVRFDRDGTPLAASRNMLARLQLPPDRNEEFRALIPEKMIQEVFRGPQGVRVTERISNYRIYLDTYDRQDRVLFNVSGYMEGSTVNTLWQEVALMSAGGQLDEGTLTGNLKLHSIIEPYIPQLVLVKAREMAEIGRRSLPEEVKEMSVMFADLVGFTAKSESMRPHMVVELLNLAHSTLVRSIKRYGGKVDKFMGDAVMALFEKPEDACAAAVEIQNNFYHLNEFRREAGEEPILLRIGINTGSVIMADVGTEEHRDWTALGDTVNTASRIEKKCKPGGILISASTLKNARPSISPHQRYSIYVKGKKDEISVYTIRSVLYRDNGTPIEMDVIDPTKRLPSV